ncbi:MAG: hypothetical protein ACE5I8_10470, partial [Thermodesulfobacteriota bacterium]
PLPASKGLAFPFLLTLDGSPLLQQITLRDKRVPQKARKLRDLKDAIALEIPAYHLFPHRETGKGIANDDE